MLGAVTATDTWTETLEVVRYNILDYVATFRNTIRMKEQELRIQGDYKQYVSNRRL